MPFSNRKNFEEEDTMQKIHRKLSDLSKRLKYIASGQLALDVSDAPYSEVEQISSSEYPILKTTKRKNKFI